MSKLYALIVGLVLNLSLLAQSERCGFDDIIRQQMKDPQIAERILQADKNIGALQSSFRSRRFRSGDANKMSEDVMATTYEIPVVVHIIHRGTDALGSTNNPTDATVQSMINFLNSVYEGTNTANGTNTPIRFALAKRTADCAPTTGILRVNASNIPALANYVTNGVSNGAGGPGIADADLKAVSRWPSGSYYNIWIVWRATNSTGGGLNGYAYYPGASDAVDGTVIIGGVANSSALTLPHEIGHGLSLRHTFEGETATDCAPNTDCSTQGDLVCDTDPHRETFACPAAGSSQTCGGVSSVWGELPLNIMGYFSCRTKFTTGQGERALAALLAQRYSLIASLGGTPPDPTSVTSIPAQTTIATANQGTNAGIGPRKVVLNNIFYESSPYLSSSRIAYEDKTCMSGTRLDALQTVNIEVTTASTNRQLVKVWLDLNNDGVYSADELMGTSVTPDPAPNPYIHTISITSAKLLTVPQQHLNKPLRLRVAADFRSSAVYNYDYNSQLNYGQMEDFAVTVYNSALPIDFGNLDAFIQDNRMQVKWQSLSEKNNQKYLVQASKDGQTFYTIGEQLSKAANGDSSVTLDYEFSIGWDGLKAIGVSLLLFALLSFKRNRKPGRFLIAGVGAFIMLNVLFGGLSCSKKSGDINLHDGSDIYIRIGQVDKDGTTRYSKIIKAIKR